jgi:hypothetical protein|eukprot:COSAG01_NODE_223_length_21401_cov_17.490423_3_plen_74_part_00
MITLGAIVLLHMPPRHTTDTVAMPLLAQGSYMVCHFAPLEDWEEPMPDDPLHTIEGTDLNDRKKLLNLMIERL